MPPPPLAPPPHHLLRVLSLSPESLSSRRLVALAVLNADGSGRSPHSHVDSSAHPTAASPTPCPLPPKSLSLRSSTRTLAASSVYQATSPRRLRHRRCHLLHGGARVSTSIRLDPVLIYSFGPLVVGRYTTSARRSYRMTTRSTTGTWSHSTTTSPPW